MTAVEWLVEQFERIVFYSEEAKEDTIKQAKEMEKEQIVEAHGNKTKKSVGVSNYTYTLTGEQYYNETFKKK